MDAITNWFYHELTKEEQLELLYKFTEENFGLYEEFLKREFTTHLTND